MAKQDEQQFVRVEDYVKGELSKDTNWWGAFVVGLAGTILVTGVTPAVLAPLGAAAIPNFIFWALTGWLLCLYLAELAAMLPDRTGGAPCVRVLRVQGPTAEDLPAHQRRHGVDVLARVDAGHGREHDPDRRLPSGRCSGSSSPDGGGTRSPSSTPAYR